MSPVEETPLYFSKNELKLSYGKAQHTICSVITHSDFLLREGERTREVSGSASHQ